MVRLAFLIALLVNTTLAVAAPPPINWVPGPWYGGQALDSYILNSSPTCYLDPDYNVTVAAGLVSSWCCRNAPSICFVQATDSAKPVLSRGDNLENRILNSEVFSSWSNSNTSIGDNVASPLAPNGTQTVDRIYETAATGVHSRFITNTATGDIVVSVFVWPGERTWVTLRGDAGTTYFNLSGAGAVGTSGATTSGITALGDGGYFIWHRKTVSSAANVQVGLATGDGAESYAGDTSKGAYFWGAQVRPYTAPSSYIPTTSYPQFAGLNGRRVVNFDGVDDVLASTTTGATVFGASAKTILQLGTYKGANSRWFNAANFVIYESGLKMRLFNNDGTGDEIVSDTYTAGKKLLFAGTHDGSYLRGRINGVTLTPVASGATSALTAALSIGGVASAYMAGAMGPVILWNKVLPDSQLIEIERGVMKRYGVN